MDVHRRDDHRLTLADGREIAATRLLLADGPARRVTIPTLNQVLPADRDVADRLGSRAANHIAYQEYRRIPSALCEPDTIRF